MAGESVSYHVDESINDDFEDDGVIFKGSPLYDSLMQSGFKMTDNETVFNEKAEFLQGLEREQQKEKLIENKAEGDTLTIFMRLKLQLTCLCRIFFRIFAPYMDCTFQVKQNNLIILDRLKKCTALDEDDSDFLDWYIDITNIDGSTNSMKSGTQKWLYIVLPPVILSYGYTRLFHQVTPGRMVVLADFMAVMFSVFLTGQALLLLVNTFRKQKYKSELRFVDELLDGSEQFLMWLKKALRLIQEAELIARGFTLVSQRNPLSRLEEGKRQMVRQCPALRKLLFNCSRDSIHQLRQQTRVLLQLLPDNPEIDVMSGYLAYEPIENYGPCLQGTSGDGHVDSQIYSLTDGFSVSALKGISHLLMLHLSEFIKGLAIIYHHDYKYTDLDHDAVVYQIQDMFNQMSNWTDSVQRSIDFHNSCLVRKDREEKSLKQKSDFDDLYVAVHSLDLHLQSALTRVRTLSLEIESHTASKIQSDVSNLSHNQMNERMQPIKAELTSCNNCFSEAMIRLDHLFGKAQSTSDEIEKVSQSKWKDKEMTNPTVKEIEDYIIVDQVFEAYTDPDEMRLEDMEWEKPLTAEEKEKKRKEKDEAIRMMTELKSVIKIRAKETEKRETAALNRSKTELKDHLSPEIDSVSKPDTHLCIHHCQITKSNKSIDEEGENVSANCAYLDNSLPYAVDITNLVKNSDAVEIESLDLSSERNLLDASETAQNESDSFVTNSLVLEGENKNITDFSHKPESVITKQGVRRLRKSYIPDDSDSDEVMSECDATNTLGDILKARTNRQQTEIGNLPEDSRRSDNDTNNRTWAVSSQDNTCTGSTMQCLYKPETEEIFIGDRNDTGDEVVCNEELAKPNIDKISLEERLAMYSGLDFTLTSNIANMAAARSKDFVTLGETTFGEDEYGELSEIDSENEGA